MIRSTLFLAVLLLLPCPPLASQDASPDKLHVDRERGYCFRLPAAEWRIIQDQESGGAHTLIAQNPKNGGLWVVVVAPVGTSESLDGLAAQRVQLHERSLGAGVKSSKPEAVEHEGVTGRYLEIPHGTPETLLREWLFLKHGTLFLLQARHRADSAALATTTEKLVASFSWTLPPADEEANEEEVVALPPLDPLPVPPRPALRIERGAAGRIVLVRASGDYERDARRFAAAVPHARVGNAPVCLLVGDELTASQVDLLNRLPVLEIIAVGEPPAEVAPLVSRRVADPSELHAGGPEAVVASDELGDMLEAVPVAFRRNLPLLVAGAELEEQLAARGVEKVWLVAARASVTLPPGVTVEDLSDPQARWEEAARAAGDEESYLAVANVGAERSQVSGAALGAALLAARRLGTLLVLEEDVRFEYATLETTDDVPEGIESVGDVARGVFTLPEGTVPVAVPSLGPLIGLAQIDKFGDAVLDLDGDGRFDPATETTEAGSVRVVGGTPYSFSLRLVGAIGVTKFHDAMLTSRAVALTPPAEAIAERIWLSLGADTVPRYLLLAGDHREIPFDYVKDPVYAGSTMHEQELSTDNLYADPDGDGHLDVAVGRFVSSSPAEATAIASRMAAYDELRGDWRDRTVLIYPCWADDELKLMMPIVFASFEAMMRGLDADLRAVGFTNRLHLREDGDLPDVYPNLAGNSLVVFAHHAGPTTWLFRMQGSQPSEMRMLLGARSRAAGDLGPGWGVVPPLDGAPVVISAGCDSAGLDYEVAFEESIVHSFFEQGAVGYLGNTRAGFPDTEEHLIRATVQRALGLGVPAGTSCSFGEAFRRGKNYLDFLIRKRGPFRSTPPFQEYGTAMRREWHSLVYYGDPALRLRVPAPPRIAPVVVRVTAAGEKELDVVVRRNAPIEEGPIWIMEQVALGPLHEITNLTAAGLNYGSVPWGTYHDSAEPGPVAPGIFLDLLLDEAMGDDVRARLVEGPSWALGPQEVVRDARGRAHLRLAIDLVRYAMADPEAAEVADEVVLKVSGIR